MEEEEPEGEKESSVNGGEKQESLHGSEDEDKGLVTENEFGDAAVVVEKKKKKKDKDVDKSKKPDKRELTKLTILSIALTNVVPAHRFAKNSLWVKCSVANFNFAVDSDGALTGSQHEWLGLDWSFIRARNVEDRTDLVVTVGSKGVVIGRYILYAHEFEQIPNTSSGYFEISGEVSSEVGPAGDIRLICKREIAERPKRAKPSEMLDLVKPPLADLPTNTKIFVRIIRITVTELKSVHLLDSNSPSVTVKCGGRWERSTSVLVKAGSAAMWDRLPWRILTQPSHCFIFSVQSVATHIGQVTLPLREAVAATPAAGTQIEVARSLSNGVDVSGQIKVLLDISLGFPGYRESGVDYEDIREQDFENESLGSPLVLKNYQIPTDQSQFDGDLTEFNELIPNNALALPFLLVILSIAVVDSENVSLFWANKLRVHVACGSDGYTSSSLLDKGRSAQWSGLSWKFVVKEKAKLRVTVWSYNTMVGEVDMGEEEMRSRPMDDKNSQILLTLHNGDKYAGKVNFLCQFSNLLRRENPLIQTPSHRLLSSLDSVASADDFGGSSQKKKSSSDMELPVIATVLSVSLFDLPPCHKLFPNSPQLKLRCDRKYIHSSAIPFAGSEAFWEELFWSIPLNTGSDMLLSVISNGVLIGSLEIKPETLLDLPLGDQQTVELFCAIENSGRFAGNLRMLFHLKPMDWEAFREAFPAGPIGQHLLEGSEGAPLYDPMGSTRSSVGSKSLRQTKPIFEDISKLILNPKARAEFGFVLQLDIIELDVSELEPVHWVRKNSPFVAISCSRWEERTDPREGAGSDACWSSVGWVLRIREDSKLHVVVGSESTTVGMLFITAEQLLSCKYDKAGVRRLIAPICNENLTVGRFKITFVVEVVKDIAIPVGKSPLASKKLPPPVEPPPVESEEEKLRKSLQKLAESVQNRKANDENIIEPFLQRFPLSAVIQQLTVTDLVPVHALSKNSPVVTMFCDDWSASTTVKRDAGQEEIVWQDLKWTIPLQLESTQIRVSVRSYTVTVGSATMLASDLVALKKRDIEYFEVTRDLSNGVSKTGKLVIAMKLLPGKIYPKQPEGFPGNFSLSQGLVSPDVHRTLGPLAKFIDPKKKRSPMWLPPLSGAEVAKRGEDPQYAAAKVEEERGKEFHLNVIDMVHSVEVTAAAAALEAANKAKQEQHEQDHLVMALANLPVVVIIVGISLIDLRRVHTLASNSPAVSAVCGRWASSTEPKVKAGRAAIWDELEWSFVADNGANSTLGIVVTSQKEVIGSVAFSAVEFVEARKATNNKSNISRLIGDLSFKEKTAGKIKLLFRLEPTTKAGKLKESKKKPLLSAIALAEEESEVNGNDEPQVDEKAPENQFDDDLDEFESLSRADLGRHESVSTISH